MMGDIKRIKKNITSKEYQTLLHAIDNDKKLRANTKLNLKRAFILLFYCGIRLNETQYELKTDKGVEYFSIANIRELLTTGKTLIIAPKQSKEKFIYLTPSFEADILKHFKLDGEEDENKIITRKGNKKSGIAISTFIDSVNKFMNRTLGDGFTSHSFRQGIISEMSSKGKTDSLIASVISIAPSTVRRYTTITEEHIKENLVR